MDTSELSVSLMDSQLLKTNKKNLHFLPKIAEIKLHVET